MPEKIEGKYHINFTKTLHTEHPEMSALIMQTISTFSRIETAQGEMLVFLLEGSPKVGMSMYTATVNSIARRDMLLGAARAALSDDLEALAVIETAVQLSDRTRKVRRKFAHHIWGTLNERKDCLVLINPADSLHSRAAFQELFANPAAERNTGKKPELFTDRMIEGALVYSREELEVVSADANEDFNITNLAGAYISAATFAGCDPIKIKQNMLDALLKKNRFKVAFDAKLKKLKADDGASDG